MPSGIFPGVLTATGPNTEVFTIVDITFASVFFDDVTTVDAAEEDEVEVAEAVTIGGETSADVVFCSGFTNAVAAAAAVDKPAAAVIAVIAVEDVDVKIGDTSEDAVAIDFTALDTVRDDVTFVVVNATAGLLEETTPAVAAFDPPLVFEEVVAFVMIVEVITDDVMGDFETELELKEPEPSDSLFGTACLISTLRESMTWSFAITRSTDDTSLNMINPNPLDRLVRESSRA